MKEDSKRRNSQDKVKEIEYGSIAVTEYNILQVYAINFLFLGCKFKISGILDTISKFSVFLPTPVFVYINCCSATKFHKLVEDKPVS